MQVQRYGLNQATGRVEHYYVDRGDAHIARLRGTAVIPRTAKTSAGNFGRKVTGRGVA